MVDSSQVHEWLHFFHNFTAVLSMFFNSFLTFLVLTKSPKQLGVYKFLMAFISIFEIVYSILDVFLKVIHHSYQAMGLVLVKATDKPVSRSLLLVLNACYWGFFGASIGIFAVHFIYRYMVVSGNDLLRTFNSWKLCLWMMIPACDFMIWVSTGYFLCGPNKSVDDTVREHFRSTFGEDIENFSYLGFFVYQQNAEGEMVFYFKPLIGVIIMMTTVVISFSIILFFGIKCYDQINNLMANSSQNSAHSKSLQSQLFYALVMQTLIPTVLMHIPIAFLFISALTGLGMSYYMSIVSFTIALYPAVDPLPNFFVITPYRKAVLEILNNIKNALVCESCRKPVNGQSDQPQGMSMTTMVPTIVQQN